MLHRRCFATITHSLFSTYHLEMLFLLILLYYNEEQETFSVATERTRCLDGLQWYSNHTQTHKQQLNAHFIKLSRNTRSWYNKYLLLRSRRDCLYVLHTHTVNEFIMSSQNEIIAENTFIFVWKSVMAIIVYVFSKIEVIS